MMLRQHTDNNLEDMLASGSTGSCQNNDYDPTFKGSNLADKSLN